MFDRKAISPLLVVTLTALLICGACSRSAAPGNTSATLAVNAAPSQPDAGIEVEIVQPTAIEGSINATGKVVVTDDKTASIGPVHEGRVVNFYAGQGSFVRKGQKLADLQSADIDDAEAAYLKAVADLA